MIKDDLKNPTIIKNNLIIIYKRHEALLNELKTCKLLDSTRLEELNKLINKIKGEVKINNPKNNTYDSKLKELNELLDILINDRNRLALENGKLSTEIEKLKQDIQLNKKDYEEKIKQLNEDIQKIYNKTPISTPDNIDNEIEAIKKLIQDEKEKYDNTITNLRKQLTSIQNTCNVEKVNIQQEYKEKEAKFISKLNNQNSIIFKENSKLQKNNQDLINERDKLIKEFDEYKKSHDKDIFYVGKIELELKNCQYALLLCNEENKSLKNEVESLKLEIQSNIKAIKYLNTKINQTSDFYLNESDISKNTEFNKQINLLKENIYKKNKEFNEKIQSLTQQCDDEKTKLQEDYNKKEAEFKSKLNNQNSIRFNENSKLQENNQDLINKRDKLIKEFDEYKNSHDNDIFYVRKLELELTNLESKLKKCITDLDKCTQDLADCNQKNQELQEKITKLETITLAKVPAENKQQVQQSIDNIITLAKAPAENKQQVQQSIDNIITLAKINNISNTSDNDRIKDLEAENKKLKQTLANIEDKIDVEEVYIYVKEPAQVKPIQKNKVPGDIFRLPGDKPM